MRRRTTARAALLLVCLPLGACSARASSPTPAVGAEICRAGTFFRVVGDPQEGGQARIRYRLQHADGTSELEISASVLSDGGGMTALGRAQVEVQGTVESIEPESIRVARISRVAEGVTPCS